MSNTLSEEIKIEFHILQLQKNTENILVVPKKKEESGETIFNIELTLEISSSDEINDSNEDYTFLLLLNLSSHKLYLYSKNFKPFNDGRDLIYDICPEIVGQNNSYNIETKLEPVIKSLKEFANKKDREKPSTEIGNFYLGNLYDIELITNLLEQNIYNSKVYLHEVVFNKKINILCLCIISDDYFCLYEYKKKFKLKFELIFYASIKSLLSFKQSINKIDITLLWKQKHNKFNYEMELSWTNSNSIDNMVDTLIRILKKRGLIMDILKKHKDGVLPKIDIKKLEIEIPRYENQMKFSANLLLFNKLLFCYEKSVEYYSAINDSKYEVYTKKIQDLIKDERFSKFVENK